MKKLGLIGGTGPESTVVYYHDIVYGVQKRAGETVFPNLTIESLNVFDVLGFCARGEYDALTRDLAAGVERLAAAGAEFAALTGITPHIVFDALQARSPIPLVSMVETSCASARRQGCARLGMLGTYPTMTGDFFQKPFAASGISVVTPNEAERTYIGEKIEQELEYGRIVPETQTEILRIVRRMAEEDGIEAVVLGCTELPLLFAGLEPPVPCMDVMQIHIAALIDRIVHEE